MSIKKTAPFYLTVIVAFCTVLSISVSCKSTGVQPVSSLQGYTVQNLQDGQYQIALVSSDPGIEVSRTFKRYLKDQDTTQTIVISAGKDHLIIDEYVVRGENIRSRREVFNSQLQEVRWNRGQFDYRQIKSMAFEADTQKLAIFSDHQLVLLDFSRNSPGGPFYLASSKPDDVLKFNEKIADVVLSQNQMLVSFTGSPRVELYDLQQKTKDNRRPLDLHSNTYKNLTAAGTTGFFVTTGNRIVRLVDLARDDARVRDNSFLTIDLKVQQPCENTNLNQIGAANIEKLVYQPTNGYRQDFFFTSHRPAGDDKRFFSVYGPLKNSDLSFFNAAHFTDVAAYENDHKSLKCLYSFQLGEKLRQQREQNIQNDQEERVEVRVDFEKVTKFELHDVGKIRQTPSPNKSRFTNLFAWVAATTVDRSGLTGLGVYSFSYSDATPKLEPVAMIQPSRTAEAKWLNVWFVARSELHFIDIYGNHYKATRS